MKKPCPFDIGFGVKSLGFLRACSLSVPCAGGVDPWVMHCSLWFAWMPECSRCLQSQRIYNSQLSLLLP